MAFAAEEAGKAPADAFFVVDDEDVGHEASGQSSVGSGQ
jgi:hypothetical protein